MKIVIDGISYNVTYPIGATLTNEGGLNQASVQIRHIGKLDPFTPFTDVEFLGEWWCIAHDNVVRERYIGRATHNITLVEITKRLERVICGAKTFTKPLHPSSAAFPIQPTYIQATWMENDQGEKVGYTENTAGKNDMYFIPAQNGESIHDNDYEALTVLSNYENSLSIPQSTACKAKVTTDVTLQSSAVYVGSSLDGDYRKVKAGETIKGKGVVYLKFEYNSTYLRILDEHTRVTGYRREDIIYKVNISQKALERAPLSINEVTEQLLITAEPLRTLTHRKYLHRGYGYAEYEYINTVNIEAPEFSFADGATLKENLDQIAKVLHARVKMKKRQTGNQYEIWFAPLTTNEAATIRGTLIGDQTSHSAEKYAGTLHTAAQNLSISNALEGSIAEPACESIGDDNASAATPMRTLRCADTEARINDKTGEIETLLPIKRIIKLVMSYANQIVDITECVREKSVYLGLSNYENEQARSYYLYYTVGERNVKGLWEKDQDAIYEALKRYSIVNVFNNAGGFSESDFDNYQNLLFYIEYEPYMNLHLLSSRMDGRGADIAYIANQAASETDKDSLADFARGTIEQMASDAPKKTYLMRSLDMVPKIGTMYDAHSYISEVSFEIYPYFVKCTVSIAEHYNRLGQRVEVPNQIRQYEIDVNNVRDRQVLYVDVCNISYARDESANNSLLSTAGKEVILQDLSINIAIEKYNKTASLARISTFSYPHDKKMTPVIPAANPIQSVYLPVASFGFANSLVFTVPFKDNFSAGSRAIRGGTSERKEFNLQEYVQYGDTYGAAELMSFSLHNGALMHGASQEIRKEYGKNWPLFSESIGDDVLHASLGATYASTDIGDGPYIYLYKDSREKITFTYQILFQSDCGIIIGNDFAAQNPIVRDGCKKSGDSETFIYFYGSGSGEERILHPITGTTLVSTNKRRLIASSTEGPTCLEVPSVPEHDAWAILCDGKFMLGSNSPFPARAKLYFNFSHK